MHSTTINDAPHRIAIGKLVVGMILLAVGVATFLEATDLWDSGSLWSYWPVLLIAIGAATEVDAIRERRPNRSFFLLAVGAWMLVGSFGLFGLSYGEAFPIAIVIGGAGMMLHALIDRPVIKSNDQKGNSHE